MTPRREDRTEPGGRAEATVRLEKIVPDGKKAVRSFRRLIDLKDAAQYGIITVTPAKLKAAIRDASPAGWQPRCRRSSGPGGGCPALS